MTLEEHERQRIAALEKQVSELQLELIRLRGAVRRSLIYLTAWPAMRKRAAAEFARDV